jgi:CRISPR/Cas system-associated exonuclease Cas4 (RecB family)
MTIKKQGPPKRISVSQINCYLSCPRKYQFQYIKYLKEVTRSSALNLGTLTHDMIAKGQFDHPTDPKIDGMLKTAQDFLAQYDQNEEKLMEKKLVGTICDNRTAVGIFDVIFPNIAKGVDWKATTNSPYKKISQDLQSFFYAKLYEQNFNKEIDEILFVFLVDGGIYSPKIQSDNFREKCEKRIQDVIDAIYGEGEKEFPKKISPLCAWCGYAPICQMFE